jgi:lactam utilization protein B
MDARPHFLLMRVRRRRFSPRAFRRDGKIVPRHCKDIIEQQSQMRNMNPEEIFKKPHFRAAIQHNLTFFF